MLRVALIDHCSLTRSALCSVLKPYRDLEVVAAIASDEDLSSELSRHLPQVALLGYSVNRSHAPSTLERVVRVAPTMPLVAFVPDLDAGYLVQLRSAGVRGLLGADTTTACLVNAIRTVAPDRAAEYITPAVRGQLERQHARQARLASLTVRQRAILAELARGRNTQEVAELLGISPKTVLAHRVNLARRLGARSAAELLHTAVCLTTGRDLNPQHRA